MLYPKYSLLFWKNLLVGFCFYFHWTHLSRCGHRFVGAKERFCGLSEASGLANYIQEKLSSRQIRWWSLLSYKVTRTNTEKQELNHLCVSLLRVHPGILPCRSASCKPNVPAFILLLIYTVTNCFHNGHKHATTIFPLCCTQIWHSVLL